MKIFPTLIKNREQNVLYIIIILAIFLRFYNLSSVPPSASLDEVSIGYNAYSILKTEVDEYGTKFPLLLRAYDDYRPALYVYLVIPFVKIFGLNVVSVRLPSVILSGLTVLATYFLTKKLFTVSSNHQTFLYRIISYIPSLTSFLLAISPWHIYISRLGHEVNAGLAFFIFGLTFFFYNKILLSLLFLTLSFVSYQAEKIFIPFIFISLLILYWENIKSNRKELMLGLLISFVIMCPFLKATLEPNALIRFQATNIFLANQNRFEQEAFVLAQAVSKNDMMGIIVHNRRLVAAQIVIEGYVSHFNPIWLFTNISADRHKVPNLGLLYLWELPFIVLGVIFLARAKVNKKVKLLLFLWIFAAPLPAAITTDAPHALRIYTIIPTPQILAALGLATVIVTIKYHVSNLHIKYILFTLCVLFFIFNLFYFFQNYFLVFPKTQSSSFQYSLSQVIPFALKHQNSYTNIVFSNENNLYQSYMFFLFYSHYDPSSYQRKNGTYSGGFAETHRIDTFDFKSMKHITPVKNTLYITNVGEVVGGKILKRFSDLNGHFAIEVIEKK